MAADGATTVVFHEEGTGRSKVFDCAGFPVSLPMRQWMAGLLAEQYSARGGPKRITSAQSYFDTLRRFAQVLISTSIPPYSPEDLRPDHVQAFRDAHVQTPTLQRKRVQTLRRLLGRCPDLPLAARQDLMRTRLIPSQTSTKVTAYSDAEWQQLMTALRHDIRTSRDRIRQGHELLARFRAGDMAIDSEEAVLGAWLDRFSSTGNLPGQPRRGPCLDVYRQAGGARGIASRLCLLQSEACSFALYLTALTGQNFGTVATWPAVHMRPDAGSGRVQVALLEASKPRRGPEREHMVTALEDPPASLREVLEADHVDERLLRSPLRVYDLLIELTATSRRLSGDSTAFVSYCPVPARTDGRPWTSTLRPDRWGEHHGFPTTTQQVPNGPPALQVGRIRQTALELRRRPVAHSGETLRNHYLNRSATVQSESRTVVGRVLEAQVAKARTAQQVHVFNRDFLDRAADDPAWAATEVHLQPAVLQQVISGEQDTVLAACTDHLAGPNSEPGQPCIASFMTCLDCSNARALPRHLPIQLALRERLLALRPNMDPVAWRVRYEARVAQLDDIIGQHRPAEVEQRRHELTHTQHRLVDDLLDGRLDLR